MKKLFLLLFIPALYFSQFQAGRYIIKQAATNFSVKSVENSEQYTRIEPVCEDYRENCANQIFDITNFKGFYSINVSGKNLFLTFESPSDNMMRFKAKQSANQLFSIINAGNGSFYIKPKLQDNANYYIGTRMDLYPNFGSELQFLVKEQSRMPREYNDFRNVSWTFVAIPSIGNLIIPNQNIKKVLPSNVKIAK